MKISRNILAAATLMMTMTFGQQGPGPNGPGTGTGGCCPVSAVAPTAEETRILTHMREEEKLARDVYRFLYQRWNVATFDRIAAAEQRHFASVGALLARYAIADPVVEPDTPGVYASENFNKLYAELTTKGNVSLKDALEVGVMIEKLDIADLEASLPASTKLDIKRVLTNLMQGSYSHLEAFEFSLELVGTM